MRDHWEETMRAQDFVQQVVARPGPGENLVDLDIDFASGEGVLVWLHTTHPSGALVMFSRYAFEHVSRDDLLPLLRALAHGDYEERRVGRRWRIDTRNPTFREYSRRIRRRWF